MTPLISWISVDSRGPSAIYVATDNRIIWGWKARRWESVRKILPRRRPTFLAIAVTSCFPFSCLARLST